MCCSIWLLRHDTSYTVLHCMATAGICLTAFVSPQGPGDPMQPAMDPMMPPNMMPVQNMGMPGPGGGFGGPPRPLIPPGGGWGPIAPPMGPGSMMSGPGGMMGRTGQHGYDVRPGPAAPVRRWRLPWWRPGWLAEYGRAPTETRDPLQTPPVRTLP